MQKSLLAVAAFFFSLPLEVHATDGVREINQTCAVETGCFFGDAPGFPVTITSAGSYRLTSNLTVSGASSSGITTETTTLPPVWANDVSVDLNGFTIAGPVTCTGQGSAVLCSPAGDGDGIDMPNSARVRVHDGIIRGFARHGLIAGDRARIRDVISESNGSTGILVGFDASVDASETRQNGEDGIYAEVGCSIAQSSASANGNRGIVASGECVVSRSVARTNGSHGFNSGGASTYRENVARSNEGVGIRALSNSIVSGNVVSFNGEEGIVVSGGAVVEGNTVRLNDGNGIAAFKGSNVRGNSVQDNGHGASGGYGLSFSTSDADNSSYAENVITDNVSGPVEGGGVNLGGNLCDNAALCP
jgi:hypothetical protein